MCIYEYDEERHMRQEREYFMEKGMAKGRAEGKVEGKAEGKVEGKTEGQTSTLLDVLGLLDQVPSSLEQRILTIKDSDTLRRWILIAARASSIADFEKKIRE